MALSAVAAVTMVAVGKGAAAVAAKVAAAVAWDGLESVAEVVAASLPQVDIAWGATLTGLRGLTKWLGPMMRAAGLGPMMRAAATSAAVVLGQSRRRGPRTWAASAVMTTRTRAALARPRGCRLWSRCTRSCSSALQLAAYVSTVCCRDCPAPGMLVIGASCGTLTWMIPTLTRTRIWMMTLPMTGCFLKSCLRQHLPALHQAGHHHPLSICLSRKTIIKTLCPAGQVALHEGAHPSNNLSTGEQ
mmetsp:Transcript_116312/g.290406  ORF Transcript_116312/g.290406 Transcript_116312/m.290406 type:complete len:245 (-) Transcript_116312:412-1146(-)